MKHLFCKDYFLVFSTDQYNHCWRVVTKDFFCSVPAMINQFIEGLKKEGQTGIALIKIERI